MSFSFNKDKKNINLSHKYSLVNKDITLYIYSNSSDTNYTSEISNWQKKIANFIVIKKFI
jgi:hypothetical protein